MTDEDEDEDGDGKAALDLDLDDFDDDAWNDVGNKDVWNNEVPAPNDHVIAHVIAHDSQDTH